MNHIYKSIFNKALGVFTAVPEFASAHGKGSERTVVGRVAKGTAGFAASALAISIGLALTSTSAVAGPGIYINDGKSDDGCLALPDASGPNVGIYGISNAGGGINVSILAPGQVAPNKDYFAMNAMAPCLSSGNAAQALDTQTNRTLFYGNDSYGYGTITNNGAKNLTLGGRLDVNSGIIGVGDRGTNGAGATNSIRMGTGTTLDDANKKINSIAIGVNTQATSDYATAIGEEALANGSDGALAIGRKATANATSGPMAIGYDAVTTGKSGIAQGYHAHTNAQSGLAIGDNAKASGIGQVAIGYASNAQKADIDKAATAAPNKADYAVTVGHYAGADYTGTNNIRTTLVGDSAGRYGEEGTQNTAVGSLAGMYVKGSNNVALGIGAGSGSATNKLEVSNTTAIGNAAKALTHNSISIGLNSKSGKADAFGGENSIAIGNAAEAMGTSSMAMGIRASTSNGHDAIALGTYATTENQKATVIGSYSAATGVQSLTIANNYDTKNLKPVSVASGTRATVIGAETTVSGNNSVAIGDTNTVASDRTYVMGNNINAAAGTNDSLAFGTKASVGGANAIALGNTAKATKENTIAQGTESVVYGKNSVSIGYKAVSGIETPTPTQTNAFSVSIGNETEAIDASTIAIGDKAKAKGGVDALAVGTQANAMTYKALAIGAYSQATGRQSTVIGNDIQGQPSIASGTRSQILGVQSNVSGDNSVSIGDTNTVASNRTYAIGNNINIAEAAVDSLAFGTKAGVKSARSIAIGAEASAGSTDTTYNPLGDIRATAIGSEAKANGLRTVALGDVAVASERYGTALGSSSNVSAAYGTAVGFENRVSGEGGFAAGTHSVAAGRQQISIGHFAGDNVANSGVPAKAADYGVFIGRYAGSDAAGATGNTSGVAIGMEAGRYGQGGSRNTAIGEQAGQYVNGSHNIAMGTNAGSGTDAEKLEVSNTAAIGNAAKALTDDSISIGRNSKAGKVDKFDGKKSIAIGYASEAMGSNAIALGSNAATNNGHDSIAMGTYAKTNGEKTISIGAYNTAEGAQSIVIAGNYDASTGSNRSTTTAAARRAIVVGPESHATAEDAVAIGNKNTVASARTYALGNNINVAAGADDSLAFGTQANVGAVHSIAMGTTAAATGIGSIALGKSASSTEQRAIAMGENALAGNEASMALGYNSSAKGSKQVSIGLGAGALKNATDAGAELATFVGHYAGADNASPTGNAQGVAVGVNAGRYGVSGIRNVAVGPNTGQKVEGDDNTAIGYNSGRGVKGTNNFAGGANAGVFVEGNNNVALGFNAGIGAEAKPLKVNRTTAVGSDSRALADDSVALGDHAIANNANSVAIGTRSTTSDVHTGAYTLNGSYTAAGLPVAANGTVSVGSAGKERQIQNVAAGVISATSTDAINGSQLYATNNYMNNFAGDVKTKLGGNAALGNDGHLTMTNIGGTGKDNVNDAIAAANTKVAAGENITVTPTTNADGSKTYTVATTKDLVVNSVKAGDTTVNKDGLTIAGGPSVKKDGINAGDKKITGVADGNVAAGSKEAVNGGQLAEVKAKADSAVQNVVSANPTALTANKVGNTVTLTPNFIAGDLVNADGTVKDPAAADEGKLVSAKTVADALKANHFVVDTKANGGKVETGSEADAKVGSGNKVTFEAGNNLVAKQANTANGGATVKFSLKDDISLNSVTAGTGANQVVLGNDGVKVGGNTYINNDGLNANSKVISNVADGVNPNDAVNKSQLDAVKGVADSAVKSVDTVASEENLVVDNNDPQNPKLRLKKAVNLTSIKLDGATPGNTTYVSGYGLTIEDGPSVKKEGINAGDKKITNVAAGDVSATSKDAVNGGQLHNVATSVANVLGGNAAVDGNGNVTSSDIGGTGANTVDDAIKAVNATAAKHTTVVEGKNVKVTKGKNAAGGDEYTVATKDDLDVTSVTAGNTTVNTNGLTITGGPSVTRGGIDAGNRVISGVKAGDVSATSQEAVNGSQLHATNTKLDGVKAKADTAVQDVKSGDENALTAVKDPSTNIVTVTPKLSGNLVDADGNIKEPATDADKGKLVTAGTVAQALANTHFVVDTKATDGELDTASQADQKIKAGNKVTLQAGKNLKAKQTNGANGAQVEFSLKDSISLTEVTAGTGDNQVVLGNNGVQVGGSTYINKDGLNANSKVISNVADGVNPNDAVNKGQLDAVKGVADSAVKSVNVANGEENLVVDNTDPKNPKLSLKKDLTADSLTLGDKAGDHAVVNKDGLTIAGGPSVKKDGIDAGDKTITNVAPGAVTAASKDAVNGGQLYNVANNVKDLIGPDATIDPATGKVTVADPAKGIGETGKGNIGDAIKHVNDAAKAAADTAKKHTTVEQGDNIVVEESLNADGGKHYKVSTAKDLNVDSVKAGDTTVNNDGVTIAGGPSVTKGGINAGGNTITNVADGVNPNDAVNKGQLDAVKGVADSAVKSVDVANGEENLVVDNTDPKNPKLSLKKDLTVDSVKAGDSTLNNDGLTIAGGPSVKKDGIDAADKKITNVAAGDVAENSKDAVNGGQLYDVAKNVADLVGPDAKIDPATGKVTVADPAKGIGETGKGNIGDAIKHVNDAAKAAADTAKKHTTVEQGDNIVVEESLNADGGKHYKVSTAKDLNVDSVKAGDTTVNNDGVTINNGPSMTKDGINANNTKVTNVADGVDVADAVNKGQLDKVDTKVSNVAQNVVNVLGGDAAVNGNGDITMSNIGETGKGNINDAIKSVNDLAKKAAAEKTSVKAKEGRSNVTVTEGVNAAGGHEYTVDVERSVTNAGSDYVTVTNNHDADTNTTTYTVDVSAKTKASLAKADSAVQGLTSKDGNLNFTKGANGNVEVSFNDNLNVKNVTTDRVQVANGPSMSKDGINAAGKAISNVANGNVAADSKDAVNGGQLHETAKSVADVIGGGATVKDGKVVAGQNGIGNTGQNTVHGAIAAINQNTANNFNQIRGDLRKMDRDLRGGIAGALATAGLPQAFRPGKSMVAAAASTYRGQSGLAIGVSRISDNGKVILKVTGNTNSRGDFGGTIGAGYQW